MFYQSLGLYTAPPESKNTYYFIMFYTQKIKKLDDKKLDPGNPKVAFTMCSLLALKFGNFQPQIPIPHQKQCVYIYT